jgi:hypothetical protein
MTMRDIANHLNFKLAIGRDASALSSEARTQRLACIAGRRT